MTYTQALKTALQENLEYDHVQDLGQYWKFYRKRKNPVEDDEVTIRKSDGAVFSFSELAMMGETLTVVSDTPIQLEDL